MYIQAQKDSFACAIEEAGAQLKRLKDEIGKVIVGQYEVVDFIIIALLCNGHILLEGVPGVAKTTMIKAIADSLGLDFKRIQFTPDLLPADLIGSLIYNPKTHEFETRKGPLFAHLILADEINRAPAKVQAALLEAMQERQVTIGSTTYHLELPFLVFATQNPIEQEGTYRLPEAQVDRFMFKLLVGYPTMEQEKEIIARLATKHRVQQVFTRDNIFSLQDLTQHVYVDTKIVDYIVRIVNVTRCTRGYGDFLSSHIAAGASPRATLSLYTASQAHAVLSGRSFVTPDDVKAVACPVLRHRISLSYEAQAQEVAPDLLIKAILNQVPCP